MQMVVIFLSIQKFDSLYLCYLYKKRNNSTPLISSSYDSHV